jgi:hypothetical protein
LKIYPDINTHPLGAVAPTPDSRPMRLVTSIALAVEGEATLWVPNATSARAGLELFLDGDEPVGAAWWFCLTDALGERLHCYCKRLAKDVVLCLISPAMQPTPFLSLLDGIVELSKRFSIITSSSRGSRPTPPLLRSTLLALCSIALRQPPAGMCLRVVGLNLPIGALSFSHTRAPDGLFWEALVTLNLGTTLDLVVALLLERPVLLLSDCAPLLSACCEALLTLLAPLKWQGTYVPILPPSLLGYVEAPTPYLMGTARSRFMEGAASLDTGVALVVDLDMGNVRHPTSQDVDPPPSLPPDAADALRPLVPLYLASRAPSVSQLGSPSSSTSYSSSGPKGGAGNIASSDCPSAADHFAQAQRCFGKFVASLVRPSTLLRAIAAADGAPRAHGSALDMLDLTEWIAEVGDDGSATARQGRDTARVFAEELRATIGFECFVNDLLNAPTEQREGLAGMETYGEGDGSGQPSPPLWLTVDMGLSPRDTEARATSAEGRRGEMHGAPAREEIGRVALALSSSTAKMMDEQPEGEEIEAAAQHADAARPPAGPPAGAIEEEVRQVLRDSFSMAEGRLAGENGSDDDHEADEEEHEEDEAAIGRAIGSLCAALLASTATLDPAAVEALERLKLSYLPPTSPALTPLTSSATELEGEASDGSPAAIVLSAAHAPAAAIAPTAPASAATPSALVPSSSRRSERFSFCWLASSACAALNAPQTAEAVQPKAVGDGSALSSVLVLSMAKVFLSHAAADGSVTRAQLLAIGQSEEYRVVSARTSDLAHVSGVSDLPPSAGLAFWINVYNLMCMHGSVAFASSLPPEETSSALRVLRLHKRFLYTIGSVTLSAIEVEHAVLRGARPRPSFLGSSLLIPKFGLTDKRRRLALQLVAPLLSFGLVAGTAFAPPLQAYDASSVYAQLESNARTVLGDACVIDHERASNRLRIVLPVQLMWYQDDLGGDAAKALAAVRHLLPTRVALALEAALTAGRPIEFRYRQHSWRVVFDARLVEEVEATMIEHDGDVDRRSGGGRG